ncbi:3-[(3aS,4S,7aS)-7a-methyl-1,5-dioxo-octahydro-1H-inden-4-yl]propanoyl:CoA ligase-like [Haliotis rufescens]|uniref:3-[(3aS,4S,7aS)-7a-methyl-1, 5-dioxo-octahydro-1H-inden-4-yl]propanoyl:CoA ligase-like n=1 Tax=Haliotis rufescens TaxID=6454 RepID=UPI00201F9583|nr:3-[(3aS,4S,7aS)-7a-methyl-1,5-dioxo-octahydro-1H-inden-4-yl]propanoyl:CoA ligase-like [Haliotis rufescens]
MAHTDRQGFTDETIVDRIQYWGQTDSHEPAFIFRSSNGRFTLSRGDVLDLSSRFASRLTKGGLKPGEVVCIALPNSPERIVVEFGVHLAGGVSMNGQVLREDGCDLAESINSVGCKILISDLERSDSAWGLLQKHFTILESGKDLLKVTSDFVKDLEIVQLCRIQRHSEGFLAGLRSEQLFVYDRTKSTDLATIFTTSGSSGYTKLVKQSHRNILNSGYMFSRCTELSAPDKIYHSSPLGWAGGYPAHFLYTGCTRVLVDAGAGPITDFASLMWNAVNEEDVSVFNAVPIHVELLYQQAKKKGFNRPPFKKIITGGQPIKRANLCAVGFLADSLQIVYGATELGYIASLNVDIDSVAVFRDFTVGYPLPGVQLKVDCESTTALHNESRGEVLVKSPTLCMGYAGDEPIPVTDGWFHTGDIGYMNKDGSVAVEGRSSDAIMHGSYVLYPTWLEKVLMACPGVQQVAIVPVPDQVMHHEICACVQPQAGAETTTEDVIMFCRKELALAQTSTLNVVPKYVVFFEAFPLTSTGKLDRKKLSAEATSKLS